MMKRSASVKVVAPALLGLALTASAGQPVSRDSRIETEEVRASIGAPQSPTSGQAHADPAPEGPGDEAIAPPAHPPIDTVPFMPMPDPDEAAFVAGYDVESDDVMMMYNAETGETIEMPVRAGVLEALGGQGGFSFNGAGELEENELGLGGEGLGTMSVINDGSLSAWPWRGNVKLLMEFTNNSGGLDYFVCSGTMQDSGVVLTAAHCIYNRDYPAFANRVWIYPGWDGDGNLGGSFTEYDRWGYAIGTQYLWNTSWVNSGNLDRDVAAIRINRFDGNDGGRNIGALTGWFAWAWGFGCSDIMSRTYHNASYPSEGCGTPGLHNGRDMTYWFGSIDSCPDNQMRINTGSGCYTALWGGQSGSGIYYIEGDTRFVHGVASTSNRSSWGEYCKIWESFTTSLVDFENNTRGNTLDLEPLQVRASGSTSVRAGQSFSDQFTAQVVNATNNNPPQQQVTLRVYLSSNNNISTGDRLLATWNYNPNLGANSVTQFNIPAPSIPLDVTPGNYYIGVIVDTANDSNSINDDSDSWDAQAVTVLTADAPAQPALISPSNLAVDQSRFVNIDWAGAQYADRYDVYFGTDSTPDSGELVLSDTTSTFFDPGTLNYDTTYYWRIAAKGPGGTTFSNTWRFTTQDAPFFDLAANTVLWQNKSVYTQGETINIFHNVSNVGTATSPAFNIDMRLSTNTLISTSDWALGTRGVLGLSAGGSNSGTNAYAVPLGIPDGTYHLGMFFNPTPTGDTMSSNNSVVDPIQVTIQNCVADLVPPYGIADLDDADAFITAFLSQDPLADLVAPFGIVDLDDVDTYINAFLAGCP